MIAVAVGYQALGALALADQTRDGAAGILAALRRFGIGTLTMLTGDNQHVAAQTAARLGLTGCRARLLPAGKVDAIAVLTHQHRAVTIIGDGINDAPPWHAPPSASPWPPQAPASRRKPPTSP